MKKIFILLALVLASNLYCMEVKDLQGIWSNIAGYQTYKAGNDEYIIAGTYTEKMGDTTYIGLPCCLKINLQDMTFCQESDGWWNIEKIVKIDANNFDIYLYKKDQKGIFRATFVDRTTIYFTVIESNEPMKRAIGGCILRYGKENLLKLVGIKK